MYPIPDHRRGASRSARRLLNRLLRVDAERALREAPLRAGESRSLLAKAMGFLKRNSSKLTHQKYPRLSLWQRSFHEHVIRNEHDYREIWGYIDANPAKWAEDRYYEQ